MNLKTSSALGFPGENLHVLDTQGSPDEKKTQLDTWISGAKTTSTAGSFIAFPWECLTSMAEVPSSSKCQHWIRRFFVMQRHSESDIKIHPLQRPDPNDPVGHGRSYLYRLPLSTSSVHVSTLSTSSTAKIWKCKHSVILSSGYLQSSMSISV